MTTPNTDDLKLTFELDFRRLKYYHLQSMLAMLRAPAYLRHKPVGEMKQWFTDFAQRGAAEAHAVQAAISAVRGGAVTAQPTVSEPTITDDAEIIQRVLDKLGKSWDSSLSSRAAAATRELFDELRREAQKYRPVEIVGVGQPKKLKTQQHAAFERALQLASQRVNVLMTGPAGCGKTFLGGQVAEALGMSFSSISCSVGMSESQLAGWLLPTGRGGQFEYQPAPFVSMYERGGVFLLDEIDAGDANALTFINKALANTSFFIPQRLKSPQVKKHMNFVALAAANTFGTGADAQYVGRNQLDAATLDRFKAGTVVLDYDKTLEQELIHPKVLEWGWKIRELISQSGLRKIMSTRIMLDFTKMVEAYKWDRPQWELAYFSDWSADERRRVESSL